uniref:Uncharacterized protein n=1 Tax=Meloidogyne enterolobii TaxID=390850 RepID=A0A6V7W603_MELEN|nr:unnamed protein product [Meloidogyne enterolobii]
MKLILILLCLFSIITVGMCTIECNDNGVCSGSGRPGRNTRCSGCYSCTYKGCCHRSYTDQWKCCSIRG